MNVGDPLGWYWEIPVVSRAYFTLSFLTTAACALELVSPLSLYFNYSLIAKGQLWRLVTSFLFFGLFSLDFVFHMYFLIRYCRLLEENSFRGPGRRGDFVVFILFCAVLMSLIAPFVNVPFMSSSLTFAMVHLWGRRNPHIRMNFLGLFTFTASYLSTVLFSFSLILGHSATVDLIGIVVGHIYYFWDDVYVELARIRGWPARHYLRLSNYLPAEPEIQVQTDQDSNATMDTGVGNRGAQDEGRTPAHQQPEEAEPQDTSPQQDNENVVSPAAGSSDSQIETDAPSEPPISPGLTSGVPATPPEIPSRNSIEDMRAQRLAALERRFQTLNVPQNENEQEIVSVSNSLDATGNIKNQSKDGVEKSSMDETSQDDHEVAVEAHNKDGLRQRKQSAIDEE